MARLNWQTDRARRRVAKLLSYAIKDHLTITEAREKMRANDEPVSMASVKRFAGNAIEKDVFGRWRARTTVSDRLPRRILIVSEEEGPVYRDVRGRRAASFVAHHQNAINAFLEDRADESVLEPFVGKRVAGLTLETDINYLLQLSRAGELDFLEFYQEGY